MTQQRMFDHPGDQPRDEALERVERFADPEWKHYAWLAIQRVAGGEQEFTSDEIWALLEAWGVREPREPRALGALMRRAVKEGVMHNTGRWRKSDLGRNHSRPVQVYRKD